MKSLAGNFDIGGQGFHIKSYTPNRPLPFESQTQHPKKNTKDTLEHSIKPAMEKTKLQPTKKVSVLAIKLIL